MKATRVGSGQLAVMIAVACSESGCPPGFGCEAAYTYARAEGVAYRNLKIGEQLPIAMESRGRASNREPQNLDFVVVDPESVELMEFCLTYPAANASTLFETFSFRVDATLGLGVKQSGLRESVGTQCFSSLDHGSLGVNQYVSGEIELEGRTIQANSIEATFVEFDPPTLDVKIFATDDLGEAWTFDLMVESGVGGNSDFCD